MLRRFGVALLGIHAAIHLLGTVVYWRLGQPEGMTYRTELAGVHLGDLGAVAFGLAWLVVAVLIAAGAAGLHLRWRPWRAVVAVGLALSLALTVLVWPDAGWGAVLDVLLLPAVLLRLRVTGPSLGNTRSDREVRLAADGHRRVEWTHASVFGRL